MAKSKRQDTRTESVDKLRDSFRVLRGKYMSARREVARLKRELEKWVAWYPDQTMDGEDLPIVKKNRAPQCPKCESKITAITAGVYKIQSCTSSSCNWRYREKLK